jgi:hypothetical protein
LELVVSDIDAAREDLIVVPNLQELAVGRP